MTDTRLNDKLYEKMSKEQNHFRAWLLEQPPADILDHAVEYAVREDILMEIEALDLTKDQARALLASPDTMADVYKTFSRIADTGHMEVIRESIETQAENVILNSILAHAESRPKGGEREAQTEKRESVLGQLSASKTGEKEHTPPAKKRDEPSL